MPVLDAQSSIPFTLLEKQIIGRELSDIGERGGGWRGGQGDEREEVRVKGRYLRTRGKRHRRNTFPIARLGF